MDKKIFFTLDLDWACDEVLKEMYGLIQEYDIAATLNVTHDTKWLSEFRTNKKIELGIHPNFNPLLQGVGKNNYKDVITDIKKLVPEAVTVRSHALISGSPILKEFMENGLKYELNTYIPPHMGSRLYPFYRFDSILSIPFIFEDDLYLIEDNKYDVNYYLDTHFSMLRIFNFHPIHIFLKTEQISRYENSKKYYHNASKLKENQYRGQKGIRNFFIQLLQKKQEKNYEFCCISELGGAL